jgi:6-phosphofructokinase 1
MDTSNHPKTQSPLHKIAVYTSGGDAPGMNAAIRAVVRTAIRSNLEIFGIYGGYEGMITNQIEPLSSNAMANIIQRGGTILKTGRSKEYMTVPGRAQAARNLRQAGIEALVCIGGDGSFAGAYALWQEHQIPFIGIPGTIDNDIYGTDLTIGFDTAVNTALRAIDQIRDTAASHNRLFIVEVMGRDSGFIAVDVGIAGGAEEIFVPEYPATVDQAVQQIKRGIERGKTSSIIITAEGQKPGRAYDLADAIRSRTGFDSKVCILGHVQRGGAPTAADRILASRMGTAAVLGLINGENAMMTSIQRGELVLFPLAQSVGQRKTPPKDMFELVRDLAI